ncbi:hypothetical protein ACOT81_27415 [Streptomyces sp. WI04-05B]|uniref:hypothetical protein n=1 Tax=Streptomyces TaxID=1883 RepID=UPI0029BA8F4B|nr:MULTISPECIES: hypothetical protein [unclassified Streptomyces]MDX2546159.1 hypothetical protein [Streptomyces sp. WI04-05B]MDX2587151.1 hypothetical protein [Streptomyces sp. WI04-05A]MDX3750688.1 hypothetical protein [Streptomyces sp. AK08-02]
MSKAAGGPTQPLITRLWQIADAEQARSQQAEAAAVEAERISQELRAAQRVAAERHAAVLATVEAAEAYAAELGLDDTQHDLDAEPEPDPTRPTRPAASAGSKPRSVMHLIVDILELGKVTQLHGIYGDVQRLRPGTTTSAIRSALSQLHKNGSVEIVTRSVYRLLKYPEDYQADG